MKRTWRWFGSQDNITTHDMLQAGVEGVAPIRGAWMRNTFVPFPVQRNIHRLPEAECNNCLEGLADVAETVPNDIGTTLKSYLLSNRSISHGYPVPLINRDSVLTRVQTELEAANIYSRGRFGAWKYEESNQDHAFMQGVEAVNNIVAMDFKSKKTIPH